ncbi:MAG: hypothetical protein KKG50_04940 [Candidatus Omnitrophica bacterium]|nr:hypothetical protein [Candidatus Omnitrophota bacterium]
MFSIYRLNKMHETIVQEVSIEANSDLVFKELLMWGESLWWPKKSLMQFCNLSGEIGEKTIYFQKVKLPFGPMWHTRNEVIDSQNFYIKRVFLDGLFTGSGELKVLPQTGSTCQVVYTFHYGVKGFLNRVMWKAAFKRLHIKNIELILQSLKAYLEKR